MRLIIIRIENNSHSQINKGKEKDKMKRISLLVLTLVFFTNMGFAAEVRVNELLMNYKGVLVRRG